MKGTKILHLTDFHINDFKDGKEYFSEKCYERYVNLLVEEIQKLKGSVDCIVATGDFIQEGKVENFEHAVTILNYLRQKLNLTPENIGICIGNHDIYNPKEKDGKLDTSKDDISAFTSFADRFTSKLNIIEKDKRYTLCKLADHIFFLSLDSTLNRSSNQPGKLTSDEGKKIINILQKSQLDHPDNILIIGSHYPITSFASFPAEDGWYDKHVWKSAIYLTGEIQSNITQAKILYLFGDTHQPDWDEKNNQLYVTSGRIGTKIFDPDNDNIKKISHINREAKLVSYFPNNAVNVQSFYYHQESHQEDENKGYWSTTAPIPIRYKVGQADLIKSKNLKGKGEFEKKIIEYIRTSRLYKFGRFSVVNNEEEKISLGWVSINNLLADRNDILPEIIISAKDYLYEIITETNDREQILFVGIDFWGSIISSHLSLMTGNRNYCKRTRGNTIDSSLQEIFIGNDIDLKNIKYVVLITDVVSSGFTLEKVYNKISTSLKEQNNEIKYIAISVISDRKQRKKTNLSFLTAFGAFCGNLRIPVVEKDDIPDESILPGKEYFN